MDRVAFLEHLRQSRLLSGEQVDALATRYGADAPQILATALIEDGVLTRFQAKQIWAGKPRGLVLGQYRILDELGKGGFGQVFKALHTLMDRVVALKVIAPELLEDSRVRSWFQREVLASTQLCHPNIVMAYDANEVDDTLFLVMEYVAGPNLDTFVKDQGPLPVGLACEMMRQAALGLQHAHDKGMVHRDIKPGNMILPESTWGTAGADGPDAPRPGSPAPLVKVVDFGLARLHRSAPAGTLMLLNEKSFLGTPDFVSPEQARNLHNVDIRSDLYSLGCTFYYALTARRPFVGTTVLEVVVKHLETEPEPLEDVRPDVPPGVRAIIERLMAKDPGKRFQTAGELVAALAPWCGTEVAVPTLCAAAPAASGAAAQAWPPRGTNGATALVPDLAFWQGPERQRHEEKKPSVLPDRQTPVPAALAAGADEALNLPATAMVQLALAAKPPAEAKASPAEASEPVVAAPLTDTTQVLPAPNFHASAAFRKGWRQWVSVVETFVADGNTRINEPAYRALRGALLEQCRAEAGAVAAMRPAVLDRIEAILEPWVAPRAFAGMDRDTLASLLERCRQVSRELGLRDGPSSGRWLGLLILVTLAAAGIWYMERARNALGTAAQPWFVRVRALVTAYPVPALAVAVVAVILASIFMMSRALRR